MGSVQKDRGLLRTDSKREMFLLEIRIVAVPYLRDIRWKIYLGSDVGSGKFAIWSAAR